MAKKKAADKTAQINFRCSAKMKRGLEILAFLNGSKDLSDFLIECCDELIKAHERRIRNIERSIKERPIEKSVFATAPSKQSVTADKPFIDKKNAGDTNA